VKSKCRTTAGHGSTPAAVMFNTSFGSEGGVTANRILKTSLLSLSYGPSIQVYYLDTGFSLTKLTIIDQPSLYHCRITVNS